MSKLTQTFGVLATLLLANIRSSVLAISCIGCVDLDELNFDKTLQRFPHAIVKFDIAFPYGDKHEAFAQLSKSAHRVTDDLLVATVGIKDYGEMENKALGERFQVNDKNFPGIFVFRGGVKDYVQFPSHLDVTLANLQKFVTENTPLFIGLDGCLKQYNVLAKGYANLNDAEQLAIIAKAEELLKELEPEQQADAKNYIIFMQKINEKGYDFIDEEVKRLNRLKSGQVSAAKKIEMEHKLNVLETLRVPRLTKTEL